MSKFRDAPSGLRCEATVTLRDGSKAQCGRYAKVENFCTQHARMFGLAERETPTTVHGVTYYPSYKQAHDIAVAKGLPADRIISYGLGWAIQLRVSGPYFNEKTGKFE